VQQKRPTIHFITHYFTDVVIFSANTRTVWHYGSRVRLIDENEARYRNKVCSRITSCC